MSTIDRELVKSYLTLRTGRSFEVIYHLHAEPVRRSMTRSLGGFCSSEVEEFLQEFWAKLPELLERWDPERGSLRTYLVVQAAWAARSAEAKRRRRRARRRANELPSFGQDPGASRCMSAWSLEHADGPEAAMGGVGARKNGVTQAIDQYLSQYADRPAKVLRAFIEGRTGRDIAKEFGLHPAQISRDLARARARLSRELPTNV
ncbi:MAG: hypothetical protein RIT28_1095 [Pseudomonadota bacterium]